ncbi:MAG: class I SAM-dependent methyltransferase, partial [Vicinamibacteria bacterium]
MTDRLFGWGRRAEKDAPEAAESAASNERIVPTKAFSRFLYALSLRESPIVLDLGPIVGGNVNFLGERLGCKYLVEDLYQNIESHVTSKNPPDLAAFFEKRFPQADASIDGVLCWDVLDYLDKASAQIVAREMMRVLRPGGAVFGFFANEKSTEKEYTRYLIVDEKTLKYRSAPGSRARQQVFANRDITRLFEGLAVSDSFLLLTKTREMVFRK